MPRPPLPLVLLAVVALALASACTGSKKQSGSTAGGAAPAATGGSATGGGTGGEGATLTAGWIFPGPADREAAQAVEQALGGKVKVLVAENAAADAAAAADTLVGQGATFLVGAGSEYCAAHADLHCVEPAGAGPPPANVVAWQAPLWNQEYLAGLAAGKVPGTRQLGAVAPARTPQLVSAVNSLALGCQSANPNCLVRAVWLDAKGAPKTVKKAVESLAKAGAQTVEVAGAAPGLCAAAAAAKVSLIGFGQDAAAECPDVAVTSVVFDLTKLLADELGAELAVWWQGGRTVQLAPGAGGGLGGFGSGVPAGAREAAASAAAEIAAGKSPFVGPLYDTQGKQRVPDGQELGEEFLASQWDWLLGGVFS